MAQRAIKQKLYTPEQYLAKEEKAEFRSEYEDGTIIAMAGGSLTHTRMVKNIERAFDNKLKDSCESFSHEVKVQVENYQKFYYPDVVIICGEPKFYNKRQDTITNPILIVEVLSKSTEAKDRGDKMLAYRALESLEEYVLISQDKAIVEQYLKNKDGSWLHKATIGLKSKVRFESIDVELTLEEIYQRVKL
jgi:Uma2 family endonuclease